MTSSIAYTEQILVAAAYLDSYFPVFLVIYFTSMLTYMVCTMLAEHKKLPKFVVNLFRLFSLTMLTLALTLLFLKHGLGICIEQGAYSTMWFFSFATFVIANWVFLWAKNFDVRYALGPLALTPGVLGFAFMLSNIIQRVPPTGINFFMIHGVALTLVFWFNSDFRTFKFLHKHLLKFGFYKTQTTALQRNLPRACFSLTCSLSLGLLNVLSLTQNCDHWTGFLGLILCSLLLCYNALMALGLVALVSHGPIVPYCWGFVIQSYLNLWFALKSVLRQTRLNLLPKVNLVTFSLMLAFMLMQLPICYCHSG